MLLTATGVHVSQADKESVEGATCPARAVLQAGAAGAKALGESEVRVSENKKRCFCLPSTSWNWF